MTRFTSGEFIERSKSIYVALLIALPAFFPFQIRLCSLGLTLIVIFWIFSGDWRNLNQLIRDKSIVFYLLLFIIPVVSLIYSSDKSFFHIEKKLSLILFPIIIESSSLVKSQLKTLMRFFIGGCFLAAVYSLGYNLFKNFELNRLSKIDYAFYGTEMTLNAIDISHVYFGLYISFIIAYLLYDLLTYSNSKTVLAVKVFLVVFFSAFLYISGAKMSIIALFLLLLVIGIGFIILKRQWFIGVLVTGIPIIVFLITITFSEYAKGRFIELVRPENYFVGDNAWNSIGVRISIYKCAIDVFKENALFGTGLGDVQSDLNACYSANNFTTLIDMNAHNQYVQWLLSNGLVGLLIFVSVLAYTIVFAFRSKDWIFFFFCFLTILCLLTESLLERQQGVMFYAFFSSLFFFHGKFLNPSAKVFTPIK